MSDTFKKYRIQERREENMWRQFLPQVFVVKGPENGVIIAFSHKFEIFPYHF